MEKKFETGHAQARESPMSKPAMMPTTLNKPDILSIISQSVSLRKAGKNFVGLCPLHTEKTPSFTVDVNRQRWHCFGCDTGGDVLDFVQQIHGTDFRGALSILGIDSGKPYRLDPVQVRKKKLIEKYNAWKRQRDGELLDLHRHTLDLMDVAKDKTVLREILTAVQWELSIFDSRDEKRIFQHYKAEVEHGSV